MIDYRLPENRRVYFKALYNMNLQFNAHPGLVYLYLPALKKHFDWDDEQSLWFATINGHTQNPITSMKLLERMPQIPQSNVEWLLAEKAFNDEWSKLSFDTDRNKQKKDTFKGLRSYAELVSQYKTQSEMWSPYKSYEDVWSIANQIHSFGRLSTFSYLEYVNIFGFGAQCTSLMFDDLDGSRSHRNGMFFLLNHDDKIWDKRQPDSHDGKYEGMVRIAAYLENKSDQFLKEFFDEHGGHPRIGKFTLESCLCQFKNGFFSRRYPGVYCDMGWDRIKWYDERGMSKYTQVFKDIRSQNLPDWLREECEESVVPRKVKASLFAETGTPFRAEKILENI
jgi:hypothetical protein